MPSRVRLFTTPRTVAYQAPLSVEFSRPKCWNRWPFPSPGDLGNPGIEPKSPTLQADSLPSEPPGICINNINEFRDLNRLVFRAVVQSLSPVQLFATPWTAARQAPLSYTISWSLLKLMSIGWMMPSNHLILCRPLLLLPSVFPSMRVFSKELALHIR